MASYYRCLSLGEKTKRKPRQRDLPKSRPGSERDARYVQVLEYKPFEREGLSAYY